MVPKGPYFDDGLNIGEKSVVFFSVVPGVLVGHYTQLAWAQTWRIGCGKITYKPEFDEEYEGLEGQQLYICNYGIAGNFIRSEMYKTGEPCSECPIGTKCSDEFPGLCSGFPEEPLTIRPPVSLPEDFPGFPTSQMTSPRPEIINTNIDNPLSTLKNSSCIHRCKKNGGCSVRFESNAIISGPSLGSCFPPSFGGDCFGIPKNCKSCIEVCSGNNGKEIIVRLDEKGKGTFTYDIWTIFSEKV